MNVKPCLLKPNVNFILMLNSFCFRVCYPKKIILLQGARYFELKELSNVKPFDKPNKFRNIIVLCTF